MCWVAADRACQLAAEIASEARGDGGAVAVDDRGEVEVAAPGILGKNWGAMTPVGFIMGHAVYGLVLALVYSAVA